MLEEAELAATNARLAATDEQSKAETQYDSLAIESGFLAEGQSRRIDELRKSINTLNSLKVGESRQVEIGALVYLEDDNSQVKLFFILPVGAGHQLSLVKEMVTVITPDAPLSSSLKGCIVDDEVRLQMGAKENFYTVIDIK